MTDHVQQKEQKEHNEQDATELHFIFYSPSATAHCRRARGKQCVVPGLWFVRVSLQNAVKTTPPAKLQIIVDYWYNNTVSF